jgi:hypothetical protein
MSFINIILSMLIYLSDNDLILSDIFVECILESLEREKYVSNIYTWKFGVTLLFITSAPE